jgi:flagellar biosynthetic protein FliR
MNISQETVLCFFIFCRLSGCLIVVPGYSSDRIPLHSRLYLSIAISIILTPFLYDQITSTLSVGFEFSLIPIIFNETIFGLAIGLLCRFFIFAMETLATTFCLTIGLANIFDTGLIDADSSPSFSTFIVLATIQLIFIADIHHYFLVGIVNSYYISPIGDNHHLGMIINEITKFLSQSYLIALQLMCPFLIYAIIVNLSFSFLARLNTHTPVYFISGPFIILSGIYVFCNLSPEFFALLVISYKQLIIRG